MRTLMKSAAVATFTAAGMYWFDPVSGRRRRSLLRDRAVSTLVRARRGAGVGARDLGHRLWGLAARARSSVVAGEPDDDVLTERVRAALGRSVSHPGAIEVRSARGHVLLTGAVLKHEHDRLIHAVQAVRGVEEIEDRVATYKNADHISALQGGRYLPSRSLTLQENWPPATRLLAGIAGGALVLWSARQRGVLGLLAAASGGALIVRSTTNAPFDRLAGARGRRGIDIHKTIHVNAPLDLVFATLSRYENFPLFMRNVRRVRMHPDGRSHWVIGGPAGASVEWDAVTTAFRPNEVLAWRTVRSATVRHAGIIRFEPEHGGTRVDIQMTYNPPAGVLGHVVAKLFGADAKSELDQDLMRMKTYLETGIPPHDAAERRGRPAMRHTRAPERASRNYRSPGWSPRGDFFSDVSPAYSEENYLAERRRRRAPGVDYARNWDDEGRNYYGDRDYYGDRESGGGIYRTELDYESRRAPGRRRFAQETGTDIEQVRQYRGRGPCGYRRSDERIREDACDALTDDAHVDASDLDVTVKDCEVTLSGTVGSLSQKHRAEDLAERIPGVSDVHNNLRVSTEPQHTETEPRAMSSPRTETTKARPAASP